MTRLAVPLGVRDGAEQGSGLNIFQVYEGLSSGLGGPAVVVGQLANCLASFGNRVFLLVSRDETTGEAAVQPGTGVLVREGKTSFGRLGFSRDLRRTWRSLAQPDVIHIHGLWRLQYAQAVRLAAEDGTPIVLSTHGMLEPRALERRRAVKTIARRLYQDRALKRVRCLHATASSEADNLRRLGLHHPIAVIPWGVEIPPERGGGERANAVRRLGLAGNMRVLLFLSRLHPIKGIESLLAAWSRVAGQFPDWLLVVAGEGEEAYRARLFSLAQEVGLETRTAFLGAVWGKRKEETLAAAEILVLPSLSENFGLVVGEALAREIPVITTRAAPWSSLEERGCGFWVEQGVEPLAEALVQAMQRSPRELRAMGKRGREYVEKNLNLETSARAMSEVYQWVAQRGPRPSFVGESPVAVRFGRAADNGSGASKSARGPAAARRRLLSRALAAALLFPSLLIAVHRPLLGRMGAWLAVTTPVHSGDLVVALGGDRGRQETAAAVFNRGLASYVLFVGADARERDYGRLGLSADRCLPLAPAAYTTGEEAAATRAVARARQFRSVMIVTSPYHSRRTLWIFRRAVRDSGVEVLISQSPNPAFRMDSWWRSHVGRKVVIGELIGIGYYWMRSLT